MFWKLVGKKSSCELNCIWKYITCIFLCLIPEGDNDKCYEDYYTVYCIMYNFWQTLVGYCAQLFSLANFQYQFFYICYVVTVTKRQTLHIYRHEFFFFPEKCLTCQNARYTRCSAVGHAESFHTLEDFLKQMYLPNHKLLLSNFIVLDEWIIRWNLVAWFCRKPELIILNLPYNKQML